MMRIGLKYIEIQKSQNHKKSRYVRLIRGRRYIVRLATLLKYALFINPTFSTFAAPLNKDQDL